VLTPQLYRAAAREMLSLVADRGPADAVAAWTAAIADGDGARACALMSERARGQLVERHGGASCEEAIERIARALGPDRRAELRKLAAGAPGRPAPGRAVATLGELELGLERRGGRWVVADLMTSVRGGDGGPYPPPPTEWFPKPAG
jgi:hypothetical protein